MAELSSELQKDLKFMQNNLEAGYARATKDLYTAVSGNNGIIDQEKLVLTIKTFKGIKGRKHRLYSRKRCNTI